MIRLFFSSGSPRLPKWGVGRVGAPVRCLRALLLVLVVGCALPIEQSYPNDAKLWASVAAPTTAVGGVMVATKVPLYVRIATYVSGAAVIRYSNCCHRPEGPSMFVLAGSFIPEFVGIIVRHHP